MSNKEGRKDNTMNRLSVVLAGYLNDPELAMAGLTSPEPKIRASALIALHNLHKLVPNTIEAALDDPDPTVRRRACELAAYYKTPSLDKALTDADPYVIEMALWAVGEREDSTKIDKICSLATSHKESLVREAAVASLGAIGEESGLATILAALKDRPNVRRRAAVALAAFQGEIVTQALREATMDRDWQVRQIAEDLLEITEGGRE